MENQHRKIKGYRELNQAEIDLMNEIKAHGERTKSLLHKVRSYRDGCLDSETMNDYLTPGQLKRSKRCVDIAEEKLQTGQMWFVRAVALPESF